MLPPHEDLADRLPVWDAMQMVWMDVDTKGELDLVAQACSRSKYSIDELERIYWNEVRPAVSFNLRFGNFVPEWTGLNLVYLQERVLKTQRFGRRLPLKVLHPYAFRWWTQIRQKVHANRHASGA